MNGIIVRGSVVDNRDACVTGRHGGVAGDRESSRHPPRWPGGSAGGLRMPVKENLDALA
jgi:hypothetical protein